MIGQSQPYTIMGNIPAFPAALLRPAK